MSVAGGGFAGLILGSGSAALAQNLQRLSGGRIPTNINTYDYVEKNTGTDIKNTKVNDNPDTHTPEEMKVINEFKNTVDVNLVRFIEYTRQGIYEKPYVVSDNSDKAIKKALELTGLEKVGSEIVLDDNGVRHITIRHGENGKADNTMVNTEDIARMKYVLDNFDNAYLSVDKAEGYSTKNGKPAPIVMYEKKVDGHYIVVEAVSDSKKINALL